MPRRRSVRRFLFVVPVFCVLLQAPFTVQAEHTASELSDGTVRSFIEVEPTRRIAPFQFADDKGRPVSIETFRATIVLLSLWATWCPSCVREMPAFDRLQGKFDGTDFVVIPLSLDRDGVPAIRSFYERYRLRNLEVFSDPDLSPGAGLPIDVLPASFIIGRDGRMIRYLRSFVDWDAPEAEAMICRLVSTPQSDE